MLFNKRKIIFLMAVLRLLCSNKAMGSLAEVLKEVPIKLQQAEKSIKELDLNQDADCLKEALNIETKKTCLGRLLKKVGRLESVSEDLLSSSAIPGLLVKLSSLITVLKPYSPKIDEIGKKISDFLGTLNFMGFLLVGFESSSIDTSSTMEVVEEIYEV